MTEPSCVEGVERAYQEERGNAKRTRHVEKPKLGDGQGECGVSREECENLGLTRYLLMQAGEKL